MVIFYMNYEPHLQRTTPAHRPLTPLSHSTPLLPIASALFCAIDAPQPFSFQSFPHSFALFCKFLHPPKTQPFSFHAIPHSFAKNTRGWGGAAIPRAPNISEYSAPQIEDQK